MANNAKIVDAVKTEPVPAKTASVPLKIDTDQMTQALQKMLTQSAAKAGIQPTSESRVNPTVQMRDMLSEMEGLYSRFDRLRKLGIEFHGKQPDQPIPEHVLLKKVVIQFAITKDGKTEEHEAEIFNVPQIGDIAPLISTEFGVIFSALREYGRQLAGLSEKAAAQSDASLQQWEKTNNRRIIATTDDGVPVASTAAAETPAEATTPPRPVTLGTP